MDVRLRGGEFTQMLWLGMICEGAAEMLPGKGYAKIRAREVTDGDGLSHCEWRKVEEQRGEYVLGWRSVTFGGEVGVYGVVDRLGWPIIVGTHGRKASPKLVLVG